MDIKIPELGESITEGTISSWMKKEGDSVKFGDLLLELETDKVNLEINAEADGILAKIKQVKRCRLVRALESSAQARQ
jgi:2-oxoglutarate dehydrogenase E2 component (dihydrolipoamide succinyltransferase)